MTESHLTIEEAAARLGISVATARRWASSGRITATKSGKQWVVDGQRLGSTTGPRRARRTPGLDLEMALRHVEKTDLTEEWVPDVLRHADELLDSPAILTAAAGRFRGAPPEPASIIEIDKTAIFKRTAALLEIEDRVAYQAAVASFADRVDARTAGSVFSARLSSDKRYFTKHGSRQWVSWRNAVLKAFDDGNPWLLETDFTAYFDTISHKLLIAEVDALNVDRQVVGTLQEMLTSWAVVPDAGLPQGPNASRLLGNLYLLPIDHELLNAGFQYFRYLDDIKVVAASKSEALAALRLLQREARNRGLIISSAKTRLLNGPDAREALTGEVDLSAAEYLMQANASDPARKELRRILRRALTRGRDVDQRRAKFSLWRLAMLRDGAVLRQVLENLEELAPLGPVVAAYLRPFVSRPRVVKGLAEFLGDPTRSHSDFVGTWLFAAMLEHPGNLPSVWTEQAIRRVRNRNAPDYLRAVAAIVMGRSGRSSDVNWIRRDIKHEHNPAVLRGYAVALHWAKALDRDTQRQLVARSPRLKRTLAYLDGRSTLPSLAFARSSLRIS